MTEKQGKYNLFLELLKAGVEGYIPTLPEKMTPEEWEFLYATARRHAVQGLVYDALEKVQSSSIPADLAARWALETVRIEQNYRKICRIAQGQEMEWKSRGITASQLKGLVSAKYYRHPEHRIMGDIDWWFHTEEDWNAALQAVKDHGARPEYDSDGDFHYEIEGTVIEHHRKGYELEGPCGELLLLNAHILHHAMVMGIGMRQICDYKAALLYYEGKYDKEEYGKLLSERGLTAWTEVLDELPEKFLSLVLEDGNFGLEKKNRLSGFFRRAAFFMRIAPKRFCSRWWGLFVGRLKRK